MPILPSLTGPADLRGLDEVQLAQLAPRSARRSSRPSPSTGGHLGSSLGVVELTLALHRLLESPRDRIVWDTGHQAYPHKLLTGRLERFGTLRQLDGDRRVPAPLRVAPRRLRRRPRRHRPVDRRGPGRGARHPPRPRADRGRRRRRGADERPVARGAQRHRPAPDPDADRAQRQRDVDQPDGRRVLEVPQPDQALDRLAAEQGRLRPRTSSASRSSGPTLLELSRRLRAVGRPLRPARAAVRGPRHHLHRRRAGPRPACAPRDARPGARAPRAR